MILRNLVITIIVILAQGFNINLAAQNVSEMFVTSDTLQVFFRQNKATLEPQYRDNGQRLSDFTSRFNHLQADSTRQVRSILIVSGASPEGSYSRNSYLSNQRAKVVKDYLISNGLADASAIEIESRGVDWQGLADYVAKSELYNKEDVLEIIIRPAQSATSRRSNRACKQIKELDNSYTWELLYDRYFPNLRGTKVMIAYNILRSEEEAKAEQKHYIPVTTVSQQPFAKPEFPAIEAKRIELTADKPKHQSKPLRFAIESNLLYDAAVIPNIGAEIAVWRGLTVGASYQYIWMRNSSLTRWLRFEGTEATANWYFDTPFSGHHVGIYAQICTWDFTINGRGYLAERWTYGGGVSYGYNLPIAKRFNLDFEIGIGYLHGKMHRYTPQDTHRVWHSLKPFNWFGPTKLGITLQWFIGSDNCNERRSGI